MSDPAPDTAEWTEWKLTDESWEQWRRENADLVAQMAARLAELQAEVKPAAGE